MSIRQWIVVLTSMLIVTRLCARTLSNSLQVSRIQPCFCHLGGRNGFSLKAGDSLVWRRDIVWLDNNKASMPEHIGKGKLAVEIERQLMAKGLKITRSGNADYHIVAALLIGDSPEGDEIKQLA